MVLRSRWVVVLAGLVACGPGIGPDDEAGGGDGADGVADDGSVPGNTSGRTDAADGAEDGGEAADSIDDGGGPADGHGSDNDDGPVDTGAADSEGSTAVPCIPLAAHGDLIEDITFPGYVAYEGCEDESILLEHPGRVPMVTVDDVAVLRDGSELFPAFPPESAYHMVGTGLCCSGSDEACVFIGVHEDSTMDEAIADVVEDLPNAGDLCFGIRLEYRGVVTPD